MSGVTDNQAQSRFELTEQGQTAFAIYRRYPGRLVLPHVEAPPALRGKGTASRLMEGVVAIARADSLKVVPLCSYAAAWLENHPEARDLLDGTVGPSREFQGAPRR
jgi:predicted GNAT family acetyltransferase